MKERKKEFLTRFMILFVFGLSFTIAGMAQDLTLMISPQNGVTSGFESTAVYNGKLYFAGYTEATGSELFQYDGSNPPQLVADLQSTYGEGSQPFGFVVLNNLLYFGTQNGIYAYDGVNSPVLITSQITYQPLTVFNGKLYFTADVWPYGTELWSCDGVNPATLVQDITPGYDSSTPTHFCIYNGKLYFSAYKPTTGTEIYYYDGVNPVQLAVDVVPGTTGSYPNKLTLFNGKMFFWVYDTYDTNERNNQLWSWDFTNPPSQVANVSHSNMYMNSDLKVYNNRLYFFCDDYLNGFELWSYDGVNSPALVQDTYQGTNQREPSPFLIFAGKLYFAVHDGSMVQLWNCNTANTLSFVAERLPADQSENYMRGLFTFNDELYFSTPPQLWKYTPSALMVISPNGNERWDAGSSKTITWNAPASVTAVNIDYSVDDGASWSNLAGPVANTGAYAITVPNTPSTTCRIRVSDVNSPAFDISNAAFTIALPLSITVTYPNGGETLTPGSQVEITWTAANQVGNELVILQYSTNGGSTWTNLDTPPQIGISMGSVQVTLPNVQSATCLVRVNETTGKATDQSDALFKIENPRYLMVTEPQEKIWLEGSTYAIQWQWGGLISTVKIEYTTDGEQTWETISAATPNTGSYNWTVPDIANNPAKQCKIRITDLETTIQSDSLFFSIIGTADRIPLVEREALIALYNATGGDNWTVDGTSWRDPENPTVFLPHGSEGNWGGIILTDDFKHVKEINLYNRNMVGDISDLTAFTALTNLNMAYNQLTGPIPGLSTTTGLKELSLYKNQLSGSIPPTLGNLTQLESILLSENRLSGNIPSNLGNLIMLNSLRLDKNKFYGSIPDTLMNLTNLYSWGIDFSWNGLYTTNTTLRDFINNHHNGPRDWETNQTLAPEGLAVANIQESSAQISWQAVSFQSVPGGYEIYRSTTSGSNYVLQATINDKSQTTYTATDLAAGTVYYYVIKTFTNPHTNNVNRVTSEFSAPLPVMISSVSSITVTSPNGGESWEGLTTQTITWTYTGIIPNVKLEYSTDNGSTWNIINSSAPNTGAFNWTVVNTPSALCLLKVSDAAPAGTASDTSNSVFTITPRRTLTITAPNGGQRWFIGSTYAITWTSTGAINNVKIEYSLDSGNTWNIIINSTANSGTYNWQIPSISPSANSLIRVTDVAGLTVDVSNTVFTIDTMPTITVTAPNGGQTWNAGSTHSITWSQSGTIANVAISYSTNNGSTWIPIVTSITNMGSYSWLVPAVDSATCLVKVSDTATSASDTSNSTFSIWRLPSITVTAPNGGEIWPRNTYKTITWTSTGNITSVQIQYTQNGGSTWTTITSSTSNSGTYTWWVPNVSSTKTTCKVKIIANGVSAQDISNNNFTISR